MRVTGRAKGVLCGPTPFPLMRAVYLQFRSSEQVSYRFNYGDLLV